MFLFGPFVASSLRLNCPFFVSVLKKVLKNNTFSAFRVHVFCSVVVFAYLCAHGQRELLKKHSKLVLRQKYSPTKERNSKKLPTFAAEEGEIPRQLAFRKRKTSLLSGIWTIPKYRSERNTFSPLA